MGARARARPLRAAPAAAGGRASRSCPTRRRATSSSTSRATRSGTATAASSTSGGSSTPTGASRRSGLTTTTSERAAFETFVDLVHERLASTPTCTSTTTPPTRSRRCKRLMGRYGTREAELDDLLRRGVFVDLLKVVRNGLRASRPGYGLKEMEAFLDFDRAGGGQGRRHLDRRCSRSWMQTRDQALLDADRGLQRGGLRRDAAAARLAARAARGGARRGSGRSRRRSRSSRSRCRTEKAERAALRRGAARRGRGAGRAAARLPRPRAQAGLVGVLRPARDDARGARRGRRVDRRPRADRRAASR